MMNEICECWYVEAAVDGIVGSVPCGRAANAKELILHYPEHLTLLKDSANIHAGAASVSWMGLMIDLNISVLFSMDRLHFLSRRGRSRPRDNLALSMVLLLWPVMFSLLSIVIRKHMALSRFEMARLSRVRFTAGVARLLEKSTGVLCLK